MKLNSKQEEAIKTINGPLLILASPGSGKTRIITERIKFILESGYSPESILAISFTNAAASEMYKRLKNDLGESIVNLMTICTFHKLAIKIISTWGHFEGYNKSFTIYDENDQADIVNGIISDLGIKKPSAKQFLRKMYDPKFEVIRNEYLNRLKANNAFDFNYLILLAITILVKYKNARESYQYKFRFISVDEFQDINMNQHRLISIISQKWNNICSCGDDSQNIMSFQGSDIKYILGFKDNFKDAKSIIVDKCYRCPSNILSMANNLIKHNENRSDKEIKPIKTDGIYKYDILDTELDEVKNISDKCIELHNNGIMYKDMALLYRLHHQSELFKSYFTSIGIPYQLCGKTRNLMLETSVKDLNNYLRCINNDYDYNSFRKIINIHNKNISWITIMKANNFSLASDLGATEGMLQYLKNTYADTTWIEEIISYRNLTFNELYDILFKKLYDINNEKGLIYRNKVLSESKIITYNWMRDNNNANINDYLNYISELTAQDDILDEDDKNDGVHFMTCHASKGLEFKVVFIPGLEQGIFPMNKSIKSKLIEDERRLLYVALTRAKEQLYLSSSNNRELWGKKISTDKSIFIKEMEK